MSNIFCSPVFEGLPADPTEKKRFGFLSDDGKHNDSERGRKEPETGAEGR